MYLSYLLTVVSITLTSLQVQQHNPWLTYGEPLHRLREFGASMKEMDIIDESTVSSEQMRIICAFL